MTNRVGSNGKAFILLLLLMASVVIGLCAGALGVPRLLPKPPLDSKWRDMPLIGVVLPVDLATVKPVYSQAVDPEMERALAELKAEKQKWDARSKLIEKKEQALSEHEKAVAAAEKQVAAMREQLEQDFKREFKARVIEIHEAEKKNLKRLSKIYGQMKPDDAARLVKALEDETVVKILSLMKERQAGMVLAAYARTNETDAKRAAEISEMMRKVFAMKDGDNKEVRR